MEDQMLNVPCSGTDWLMSLKIELSAVLIMQYLLTAKLIMDVFDIQAKSNFYMSW